MKVPSKDRKEWRQLLKGELGISFNNFFYQAKILQARTEIERGKLSIDEAVEQIYDFTTQFCEAKYVSEDIEKIFGMKINNESQDKTVKENKEDIDLKITQNDYTEKTIIDNIQNNDAVVKQKETLPNQNIMLSDFKKKTTKEEIDNQLEKKEIDEAYKAKRLEAKELINKQLEEERERKLKAKKENQTQAKKIEKKPTTRKIKSRKTPKKKSRWNNLFGK
jgi:hypothetical protein